MSNNQTYPRITELHLDATGLTLRNALGQEATVQWESDRPLAIAEPFDINEVFDGDGQSVDLEITIHLLVKHLPWVIHVLTGDNPDPE